MFILDALNWIMATPAYLWASHVITTYPAVFLTVTAIDLVFVFFWGRAIMRWAIRMWDYIRYRPEVWFPEDSGTDSYAQRDSNPFNISVVVFKNAYTRAKIKIARVNSAGANSIHRHWRVKEPEGLRVKTSILNRLVKVHQRHINIKKPFTKSKSVWGK